MDRAFTLEYWLDDGWHVGQLKELPSIASQGATLPDLIENIQDAYRMMEPDFAEDNIALSLHRKGSGAGQRFDEIRHLAVLLEVRRLSIGDLREWREKELAAGRPHGLEDYFRTHGVCRTCRCDGLEMTGWDEAAQVPLWTVCSACGGTGRT